MAWYSVKARGQIYLYLTHVHSGGGNPGISFVFTYVYMNDKLHAIYTIGVLGFDSRQGLGIFLFATASRTALWSTQPPIQWVPGDLSFGVKRTGREADHPRPTSAEVKEWVELYLHSPNTPSWRGAQLKHKDNFTLYIYIYFGFTSRSEFTWRVAIAQKVKWLGYRIEDQGSNPTCQINFSFLNHVQIGSMATQNSAQWVPHAPSPGSKMHSPPPGAEIKNEWGYTSTRPYVFIKHNPTS
jgi:hypothetical protein